MNEVAQDHSQLLPMSNFFGQPPNPEKDPYDRRKVKQLNDISFESDEDFEDVKNLKRLNQTVLTEETLRKYLGNETERVTLEHHYWINDHFLDKIGRMAPNLKELSLRRMKITNRAFTGIVQELSGLIKIDVSSCPFIEESGLKIMFEKNLGIEEI